MEQKVLRKLADVVNQALEWDDIETVHSALVSITKIVGEEIEKQVPKEEAPE